MIKLFLSNGILSSAFILVSFRLLSACSKKIEVITTVPQITGITVDGIKATQEGNKFTAELSYTSTVDLKNVKSDEIVVDEFVVNMRDAGIKIIICNCQSVKIVYYV